MWFLQNGLNFTVVLYRILSVFVIIFLVLPLHEFAHAFVAYKLGDPTAKNLKRMTINPLKHFDPLGAICMFLFGFGWANPVPVNPYNFKNPKIGQALVSLAGPFSNLLAAFISGFVLNLVWVLTNYNPPVGLFYFFRDFTIINISLAIFNLIPLPPLDGFRAFEAIIPQKYLIRFYYSCKILPYVLMVVLLLGFLSGPFGWIINRVFEEIIRLTGWFFT